MDFADVFLVLNTWAGVSPCLKRNPLRKGHPGMLLVGICNSTVTVENSLAVPQNIKPSYHVIQEFHSWVYTQEKWKHFVWKTCPHKNLDTCS